MNSESARQPRGELRTCTAFLMPVLVVRSTPNSRRLFGFMFLFLLWSDVKARALAVTCAQKTQDNVERLLCTAQQHTPVGRSDTSGSLCSDGTPSRRRAHQAVWDEIYMANAPHQTRAEAARAGDLFRASQLNHPAPRDAGLRTRTAHAHSAGGERSTDSA